MAANCAIAPASSPSAIAISALEVLFCIASSARRFASSALASSRSRARKIQRFLSQPFFVAEVFTGSPGKFVSLKDTIRGFKAIVDGEYDHLPEQAFYMIGGIEEAVEKAKTLQ